MKMGVKSGWLLDEFDGGKYVPEWGILSMLWITYVSFQHTFLPQYVRLLHSIGPLWLIQNSCPKALVSYYGWKGFVVNETTHLWNYQEEIPNGMFVVYGNNDPMKGITRGILRSEECLIYALYSKYPSFLSHRGY